MARRIRKGLTVEVRQTGPASVITVTGSADIAESEKLQAALDQLTVRRVGLIVLDLAGMDFICSVGLGAIITAHLKGRHHKARIRLVNPQPAVRQVLETTRLTKLFPIYSDLQEAVKP